MSAGEVRQNGATNHVLPLALLSLSRRDQQQHFINERFFSKTKKINNYLGPIKV
jgi:hypothetical protein